MDKNILNVNSITFGKYKGKDLELMLKDREYCKWIINEEWFQNNYEYIYNRILEYEPRKYFLPQIEIVKGDFVDKYVYFNLKTIDEVEIELSDIEKECYKYYLLFTFI